MAENDVPTTGGPIREAFTVRLRPGAVDEWERRHQEVWPDLLAVQAACGFHSMSVYASGQTLFVFSEVSSSDSWERLIDTPEHKRWVEAMSDLSESALPDSTVDRGVLREVLHLDFDAEPPS